ncbi:MAG: hypothetical protein U5L03_10825 [Burkholderiaceae bacterium]|nr:hypothetical protein [Burkholderiaceae bacterium]
MTRGQGRCTWRSCSVGREGAGCCKRAGQDYARVDPGRRVLMTAVPAVLAAGAGRALISIDLAGAWAPHLTQSAAAASMWALAGAVVISRTVPRGPRKRRASLTRGPITADLIDLGQPLPVDVYDNRDRLLLRQGAVVSSPAQLERLLGEGLYGDAAQVTALIARRAPAVQPKAALPSYALTRIRVTAVLADVKHALQSLLADPPALDAPRW